MSRRTHKHNRWEYRVFRCDDGSFSVRQVTYWSDGVTIKSIAEEPLFRFKRKAELAFIIKELTSMSKCSLRGVSLAVSEVGIEGLK
jgi:hypothetical protein